MSGNRIVYNNVYGKIIIFRLLITAYTDFSYYLPINFVDIANINWSHHWTIYGRGWSEGLYEGASVDTLVSLFNYYGRIRRNIYFVNKELNFGIDTLDVHWPSDSPY